MLSSHISYLAATQLLCQVCGRSRVKQWQCRCICTEQAQNPCREQLSSAPVIVRLQRSRRCTRRAKKGVASGSYCPWMMCTGMPDSRILRESLLCSLRDGRQTAAVGADWRSAAPHALQ